MEIFGENKAIDHRDRWDAENPFCIFSTNRLNSHSIKANGAMSICGKSLDVGDIIISPYSGRFSSDTVFIVESLNRSTPKGNWVISPENIGFEATLKGLSITELELIVGQECFSRLRL